MSLKRSRTSRASKPKQQGLTQKQRGFGRPQDDPLQTYFMKKLRNCKLQVINAQSQAQIQFFKFQDMSPQSIAHRKLVNDDDNYGKQKMLMIKNWFKQINNEHYELLWNSFQLGVQKWEFKQINTKDDFPEYLFCDECDLSYVLYTALHSPLEALKNKTDFTDSELLFFQLLCFAARDQISFRVIKTFKTIYDQIIKNMSGVKDKVTLHYQNSLDAEKEQQNFSKNEQNLPMKVDHIMKHQVLPIELLKGGTVSIPNDQQDQTFKTAKTKKIEKEKPAKSGRPKAKASGTEEQAIEFKDIEVLLHKLITHIAWAYRYIYPEERKKKQLISIE